MKAWFRYAAVSALVLLALALGVAFVIPGTQPSAVWLAAAVAFVAQMVAFAVLLLGRGKTAGFVAGWGGGMAIRFAAVAGMAVWVSLTDRHHPETALVSLVGFVMVLALIEPVFMRMAD
jgi:hypothetical protein